MTRVSPNQSIQLSVWWLVGWLVGGHSLPPTHSQSLNLSDFLPSFVVRLLFVRSLVRSFVRLRVRSFVRSFVRLLVSSILLLRLFVVVLPA